MPPLVLPSWDGEGGRVHGAPRTGGLHQGSLAQVGVPREEELRGHLTPAASSPAGGSQHQQVPDHPGQGHLRAGRDGEWARATARGAGQGWGTLGAAPCPGPVHAVGWAHGKAAECGEGVPGWRRSRDPIVPQSL